MEKAGRGWKWIRREEAGERKRRMEEFGEGRMRPQKGGGRRRRMGIH